jgi:hypothetical protein
LLSLAFSFTFFGYRPKKVTKENPPLHGSFAKIYRLFALTHTKPALWVHYTVEDVLCFGPSGMLTWPTARKNPLIFTQMLRRRIHAV